MSSSNVPLQKLPLSKKTEEWEKSCIDYFISKSHLFSDKEKRQGINYDLYNSIFDPSDLEYITDPFGVGESFPANPQNFNIIKPKIDLLIGEESKRPFNFRVIQTNEDAVSKMLNAKKEMLSNIVAQMIMAESGDKAKEDVQMPEEVEKYFMYSYRDIAEVAGQSILDHLMGALDIKGEFVKGWKDSLVAGEEFYYVGIVNGEPYFERINPMDLDYDPACGDFIEEGDWVVRKSMMSAISIADRFNSRLKDDDLDKIINNINSVGSKEADAVNYETFSITFENNNDGLEEDGLFTVYHVEWKAFRKIGILEVYDAEGNFVEQAIVDETYKSDDTDVIEWVWIPEVREGYKIGTDIYIGMGLVDNEPITFDRPYNHNLSYVGAVYNNTNTKGASLVDIMKPLQYFYIILWYRLELMLSRDKGKVLTIDVTQIPKSMGIDTNKWLHYISAMGINFINPYEEGWDVNRNGHPSSFNQFSSIDLTSANIIEGYVGLMGKIEDMVGELSGVSRQRQGAINSNELVGNVERALSQSSFITEPLFWQHNQVKRRALEKLLNLAKYVYAENEKILHYITDDMARVFLKISKDVMFSDLSLFVSDSTKDYLDLQAVKNLAQPAMQNGVPLSEVAEIITNESVTKIKNKLKKLEYDRAQKESENAKAQQALQEKVQANAERMMAEENARKNAEISLKERELNEEQRSNMADEDIKRESLDKKDSNKKV